MRAAVPNESSETLPENETYGATVRLRGREYPQLQERRSKQPVKEGKNSAASDDNLRQKRSREKQPPKLAVKELKGGATHAAVRTQLTSEIVRRLPFLAESQHGTTMELVQSFYESHGRLSGFRSDLESLVPYLCKANLEFRQDSGQTEEAEKQAVLERKLTSMVEKFRLDIRPIADPVGAQLLALSPEQALAKLQGSLRNSVNRFVKDLFDSLDRLVDQEVCGLVEWTSKNTCCYHFFREVIIQDREELATETSDLIFDGTTPGRSFRNIEAVDRGTHTHRIARHEYHTGDAVQTTIADTQVVLPLAVRELLDRIPDWLESVVRIIDGTLVRALIVERDIETESWENRQLTDRVYFRCEPGVVIDHIVLTGWGPLDIDAELFRRELEDKSTRRTDDSTRSALWATGCGLLSLFSLALHWFSGGIADLAYAYVVIVLAVGCCLAALNSYAIAHRSRFRAGQPFAAGLSLFLVLTGVGLGCAFGGGALSLPFAVAALGGLLMAIPVFRSDIA